MDWLRDAVAGALGRRRRRRHQREQEKYREEMQRWAALVAYVNDELAEGGGESVGEDGATTAGLVVDRVSSLEDGQAFLDLIYEDTTGRIQQVQYQNLTPWTLYIEVALPMGQPRRFSFPPNTANTIFDIPQNARPNMHIDDLSIGGGFTEPQKGNR